MAKNSIPPANLKDDWRYKSYDQVSAHENENSACPNSPLDIIYYNLNHPQRSPWLSVASLEKTIPHELLEKLHFLTKKQKETIRLHAFEGYSFQEIAEIEGTSKQAIHQRFIRAKRIIFKKIDTVYKK
jgi:DNA-directed RNA polymerase specialized sigma24 family protein